jgi:hypothetical protein
VGVRHNGDERFTTQRNFARGSGASNDHTNRIAAPRDAPAPRVYELYFASKDASEEKKNTRASMNDTMAGMKVQKNRR